MGSHGPQPAFVCKGLLDSGNLEFDPRLMRACFSPAPFGVSPWRKLTSSRQLLIAKSNNISIKFGESLSISFFIIKKKKKELLQSYQAEFTTNT